MRCRCRLGDKGPVLSEGGLRRALVVAVFGLAWTCPAPESHAAAEEGDSTEPSAVEPTRYRGRYVPPAEVGEGPDPYAPGPDSPYWVRLEVTDAQGRATFPPRVLDAAARLRYEDRNPRLGLDLDIDLTMGPQPFMTVNEKIYPVDFDFRGWRLQAHVTADVGLREFERAWFAAFAGRRAVVSGLPAAIGDSARFRVEEASLG